MWPCSRRRVRAFFSYAREDQWAVATLVDVCRAVFVDALIDYRFIAPGTAFAEEIQKAIDKADVFFVLWTRHSAKSQWVSEEIDRYLLRIERSPKLRLVPVLFDDTPLREDLKRFHFINMTRFIDAEPAAGHIALGITTEGASFLRREVSREVWPKGKPPLELRVIRFLKRLLVGLTVTALLIGIARSCS